MRKFILSAIGLIAFTSAAFAQKEEQMITYIIDSVVRVTATRATATTPMPHTNVDKAQLQSQNFGQDVPFMLNMTPSTVVTSEAGAGVGPTTLRIRGTQADRINLTLDGVPMNDAESHGIFWQNMPDLVSSLGSIQVQRGVGTSTNGAGAFGGSLNMMLDAPMQAPYTELSGSYGSFNTHRETLKTGSGLLKGRWAFDARLSNMHSDGYIRRATTDSKSYFARAGYYNGNTVLQFIALGGVQKNGLAWNGTTPEDIAKYGRRYNAMGEISPGAYYDNQTDNYDQQNYQLHLRQSLSNAWRISAALHFTKGDGYYEEYRKKRWLAEYAMQSFEANGTDVETANIVRRKMMDNWFGGGVFALDHTSTRLKATLGAAANRYDGKHYGRVMWIENYPGPLSPLHRYYDNDGIKDDANIYAKADFEIATGLHLYGDMQYRHIAYRVEGVIDLFDWTAMKPVSLDIDHKFDFFNPKAGVFYKINPNLDTYASVAVAHREPPRNNYTDNAKTAADGTFLLPRAERLTDFEAGLNFRGRRLSAGVNLYYMLYKDQFVMTGEANHIGEALVDNVPDSYRAGIELTAGVEIARWLRWDVNTTLSQNKIRNYTEVFDGQPIFLGDVDMAYSPSVLAGSLLTANVGSFAAALQTNYVGSQFVTNSERKALSLDPYCVSNLRLSYTRGIATFGMAVNNLLNEKYSPMAFSAEWADGGNRASEMYLFPQAGTNVMTSLTLKF